MKNGLIALFLLSCLCMSAAEFIQGIYTVSNTDAAFERVKRAGFNYVQAYHNPYAVPDRVAKQFELAQKYGLKVMACVVRGKILDDPEGYDKIRAFIRQYKDHPALGGWYLYDEPHGKEKVEQLKKVWAIVREESPNVKSMLCIAQKPDWRDFTGIADIIMADSYPVYDEPFPEAPLHYYSNYVRDMSRYGKPMIAIPQIMNHKGYDYPAQEGYDVTKLRYPNETELRYFFYSALTMGNTVGTFWYSFHDLAEDKNVTRLDKLAPLFKEFNDFAAMLKDTRTPAVLNWAQDNGFHAAFFDGKDGKKYFVLINGWPAKRHCLRWTENLIGPSDFVPFGFTHKAKLTYKPGKQNKLQLEGFMGPWETMIFEVIPKPDNGEKK